ncbi:capsular polysaccharide biosynthesis protein [Acinetobacter shaoyimingii]|uniref:Capsular polysaccharide biosynthesis protein n=1 Tax=Acinetobacter shaoyimingii TaxID=2715164 RepID=A0A6G8RRN5_9GAMM|nr:capsular polysaccharide biosynthesis protein [Acinetobacter shaoyimingii]QIO04564.1 capsular polysaccharide biosynthesis protein [Acinetobacter shaoyimingii]
MSLEKIANIHKFFTEFYFSKKILGWGRKPSYYKAEAYAQKHGLQCLCSEDGFIRSLGLGKEGYQPLSIVVDQTGIYFDSTVTSDLEKLILQEEHIELNQRAKKAIQFILAHQITKYNQSFNDLNPAVITALKNTENILLIDQTFGDESIKFAGANAGTFKQMLKQAHQNHPNATIWIKTHPDVLAGKSQGHFATEDFRLPYVKAITDHVNPFALFSSFSEVYVVSSQMGFEALLAGKRVHCFGIPWYAGWGITNDRYAPIQILQNRRGINRSLEHLFACAYLKYARYVSPITQESCELEDILKMLIPNIEFQKKLPGSVIAYGFSPWKKQFICDFLNFPKTTIQFKKFFKPAKKEHVLAWGQKAKLLKDLGYKNVITVEDGFIRSIGLGANLIRPCSLVFDDIGIYYDATSPSRIEQLFNNIQSLDTEQQLRVDRLLKNLRRLEISKYNVGVNQDIERPSKDKKIILVVGQVEDDMSIQLGGVDIKTNLKLLQQVRLDHPQAYVIYKPHPDVEAGLRLGKISTETTYLYADQIEKSISIQRLFDVVDELHTISSLSGFEALIRGVKVYCYGLPFYAGWGLTTDRHKCIRRNNTLDLQRLVYVTLIEYPTYNLAHTAKMDIPLVNPEDVIDYIEAHRLTTIYQSNTLKNLFAKLLRRVSFWKK